MSRADEPDETSPASRGVDPTADAGDGEPTAPNSTGPEAEAAPEPDDAAETTAPEEVGKLNLSATKGRPVMFVLLTCGFLACLLCVLSTFGVLAFAYGRINDLW